MFAWIFHHFYAHITEPLFWGFVLYYQTHTSKGYVFLGVDRQIWTVLCSMWYLEVDYISRFREIWQLFAEMTSRKPTSFLKTHICSISAMALFLVSKVVNLMTTWNEWIPSKNDFKCALDTGYPRNFTCVSERIVIMLVPSITHAGPGYCLRGSTAVPVKMRSEKGTDHALFPSLSSLLGSIVWGFM